MYLERLIGYIACNFGAIKFGDRRLFDKRQPGIFQTAGMIQRIAGKFDFDGHLSEFKRNHLELRQCLSELFPLFGIIECHFIGTLCKSQTYCRDGKTSSIEGCPHNF